MKPRPSVAYVTDPRLPGGTSSAVAAELLAIAEFVRPQVHALESQMFHGRSVAPQIADAMDRLDQDLIWSQPTICADLVIFHNPSVLKFQHQLGVRIVARHLMVVTHENFLRPGGHEGFDVAGCLAQLDRATLAPRKTLAPVSAWNRQTVQDCLARQPNTGSWSLLPDDWFNVCQLPLTAPTAAPADRRGRHSRPGAEKFPSIDDMDLCFPAHAAANVILGADSYLAARIDRPHWSLHPFGGLTLDDYFSRFDFMVYFTAPVWRESFGRVLAEAVAAGKVALSDRQTAAAFNGAVIATTPAEAGAVIQSFIDRPALYRNHVLAAQSQLERYSAEAFRARFRQIADSLTREMA